MNQNKKTFTRITTVAGDFMVNLPVEKVMYEIEEATEDYSGYVKITNQATGKDQYISIDHIISVRED